MRVKRENQTIFLHAEPTDLVADLKAKLEVILKVDKSKLGLKVENNMLEDGKSLAESKVENEEVLFLVYKKDGALFVCEFVCCANFSC